MDAALREQRSLFRSEAFGGQGKEKRTIRPDELLRDGTRAVITGAPGCGKSTLLRWLVGKTLNNSHRLPVFLELKSINQKLFDDCRGNLVELLFNQAISPLLHSEHLSERESLKAEFTTRLAKHQVAVFLDGPDEVRNTEFFRSLCDSINRFIGSDYGRSPLIISTRPYALDVRFQDAKEMEIAPLKQRQTADFLRHYYGNDPQLDVSALIRKLQRRELSDMIRVPVLLGALVRRYREKGELTGDRLRLYDGLVRDLAVIVDREKNIRRHKFNDEEGRRNLAFLERIAFKKLFEEKVENDAERLTFDGDWLVVEAKEFCAGTKIDHFDFAPDVKATPLLREVAEDVWTFSHLTIQEYLAARVIARRSDCEQIVCRAYFNPTLVEMETLPMVLGMTKEPDDLYRAIERLPESLNFAGIRLRARGLAYGAGISDDIFEPLLSG
ncbi:MAG: NACHT domain-containing protein [Acidobacteria bacterium]|nr:NACHT domain-containing protein [Acidobacteriota bacterium]